MRYRPFYYAILQEKSFYKPVFSVAVLNTQHTLLIKFVLSYKKEFILDFFPFSNIQSKNSMCNLEYHGVGYRIYLF